MVTLVFGLLLYIIIGNVVFWAIVLKYLYTSSCVCDTNIGVKTETASTPISSQIFTSLIAPLVVM